MIRRLLARREAARARRDADARYRALLDRFIDAGETYLDTWCDAYDRAKDPDPAPERLDGLLATPETPARTINKAMAAGRNVYWVPEDHSLRTDVSEPVPDTWKRVGFTREAADEHDRWMRDTVQHLSVAPAWTSPRAMARHWFPPVSAWPLEPPKPAVEPRRLADDAVKGIPAAPEAPEDVRPAFQPEWTVPGWQQDAFMESDTVRVYIDSLIRNTFAVVDDETQARTARKVLP